MSDEQTSWRDSLPEPLREASFIKAAESPEKAAEEITNAAQYMGNSIRIPGPDAGDEAMAEFRAKAVEKIPGLMVLPSMDDEEAMESVFRSMGKPEKPEDYKLPEIEGLEMAAEVAGQLKANAHALGMTQSQLAKMVQSQHEQGAALSEQQQHEFNTAMEALKGEWGSAFDQRKANIQAALKNVDAPEGLLTALENGTLPASDMRWLHNMADALGSEATEVKNQQGGERVLTPDEALNQLSELENRADNALWDGAHPDHARLVAKRLELMKLAYPDADTGNLRSSFGV